jgi:nitroreductase
MPESENPVLDAIYNRRSIRKYTGEPVSDAEIMELIEAAIWAPSGKNNQPWRFLVVRGDDPRREGLAGCTHYARIVRDAPALIGVFLERGAMYNAMKDHQAAGSAIQNMLLAVHAKGLGAVWLGEIVNQSDQVMEVYGLDAEKHQFMALIAVGRPAQKGSSSRKPLSEFMIEEL